MSQSSSIRVPCPTCHHQLARRENRRSGWYVVVAHRRMVIVSPTASVRCPCCKTWALISGENGIEQTIKDDHA